MYRNIIKFLKTIFCCFSAALGPVVWYDAKNTGLSKFGKPGF